MHPLTFPECTYMHYEQHVYTQSDGTATLSFSVNVHTVTV